MKNTFKIAAMLLIFAGIIACGKKEMQEYEIYGNHDIEACGIEDPLKNIEWLKLLCSEIIQNKEDIHSSFKIDLYEENETREHVILIPYSPYKKIFNYGVYTCSGESTVYYAGISGEVSLVPHAYPLHQYCTYVSTLWSITIK
jgi:hypothetical protein